MSSAVDVRQCVGGQNEPTVTDSVDSRCNLEAVAKKKSVYRAGLKEIYLTLKHEVCPNNHQNFSS